MPVQSTLSASADSATPKNMLYPNAHWYFGFAIIITWVGFSTSYFGKFTQTDIYHHIHGATAGLWMAILVIQPLLYKYGKLGWHRKLGKYASIILVPLLILGGLKMMQTMVLNQSHYPPNSVYRLAWIDACSLIQLPAFIGLSLWYAKNIHLHARYMACTVLILLPPAITRLLFFIPWFNSFNKTLNGSYVITEIVLILLLIDDKRTGKIRAPYVIALLIFGFLHLTMNFAAQWLWWHNTLDFFAGI